MKPGRIEGDFGQVLYIRMIERVASQPALTDSRERWTPNAVFQKLHQYQEKARSRLNFVNLPVGHDTPRDHHSSRHGNKRG